MATKQLIIVPHCFISKGFSPFHGDEMKEVFEVMLRYNTELIQMPCPHLMLLNQTGVADRRTKRLNTLLKSTDEKNLRRLYSNCLSPLIKQVRKFRKEGIPLAGIIGVKGSPTCQACGINQSDEGNTGLYMEILKRKLNENAINTGVLNIRLNRKTTKIVEYEKM